jgi:hypothetical protein
VLWICFKIAIRPALDRAGVNGISTLISLTGIVAMASKESQCMEVLTYPSQSDKGTARQVIPPRETCTRSPVGVTLIVHGQEVLKRDLPIIDALQPPSSTKSQHYSQPCDVGNDIKNRVLHGLYLYMGGLSFSYPTSTSWWTSDRVGLRRRNLSSIFR